mmetsp:Transcript_22323/g.50023  ORF Transcript_22323/g.50023 Transcript_22323/m.50023 type:complete len:210 (-) Transcript_22323:586-1215(-)
MRQPSKRSRQAHPPGLLQARRHQRGLLQELYSGGRSRGVCGVPQHCRACHRAGHFPHGAGLDCSRSPKFDNSKQDSSLAQDVESCSQGPDRACTHCGPCRCHWRIARHVDREVPQTWSAAVSCSASAVASPVRAGDVRSNLRGSVHAPASGWCRPSLASSRQYRPSSDRAACHADEQIEQLLLLNHSTRHPSQCHWRGWYAGCESSRDC